MTAFLQRRNAALMVILALIAGIAVLSCPLTARAQSRPVKIVAFGDSLTAGYQLPGDAAFPVVLEKRLKAAGLNVTVANAGVSGDTTTGGLARLDWSVGDGVDGVILELGANDALRGLDPAKAEANLDQMLARLKVRGIKVLLAGMLAPRNNGPEYVKAFDGMYQRLADKYGATLYPFFLDGVTGVAGLTLPDGMHPNRQGVDRIVEGIFPTAEKFVRMLGETK